MTENIESKEIQNNESEWVDFFDINSFLENKPEHVEINSILDQSNYKKIQISNNEIKKISDINSNSKKNTTPPAPTTTDVPNYFEIALGKDKLNYRFDQMKSKEESIVEKLSKKHIERLTKIQKRTQLEKQVKIQPNLHASIKNIKTNIPQINKYINQNNKTILEESMCNFKQPFFCILEHMKNDPQLNFISLNKENKFKLINQYWLLCINHISNPITLFFFQFKTHGQKYMDQHLPNQICCDTNHQINLFFNLDASNHRLRMDHLIGKVSLITPQECTLPISIHPEQNDVVFSKTKQHYFKGKLKINIPSFSRQKPKYIVCRFKISLYDSQYPNNHIFSLWSDLFYLK